MLEKFLKILLIIVILVFIYMSTFGNPFFAIKMNWGIKIPSADKIVYESDTCSKSYALCATYTVVKYNSNRKMKKLDIINWEKEKNIAIETKILKELNEVVIKQKYMINFSDEYWYYQIAHRDDQLFLVYFPKIKMLYIIEQLR